ncbi:hypothetical protein IE53DRAFT_172287 [Violaceomyces palustris]|uniref:Uncharacterized protein n=1 Tax=Violaceomyces palustris TaxID=1673888 RepID=A0ACD0NT28_9BASI|nr:hypothetical protein IE53DRAFT_172287 [Violaceomyces palustris]
MLFLSLSPSLSPSLSLLSLSLPLSPLSSSLVVVPAPLFPPRAYSHFPLLFFTWCCASPLFSFVGLLNAGGSRLSRLGILPVGTRLYSKMISLVTVHILKVQLPHPSSPFLTSFHGLC